MQLFVLGRGLTLVQIDATTSEYTTKQCSSDDWVSTYSACVEGGSSRVWVTTRFNTFWELLPLEGASRRIAWADYGKTRLLWGDKHLYGIGTRIWEIDTASGRCCDVLDATYTTASMVSSLLAALNPAKRWSESTAATFHDGKIYITTITNCLYGVDIKDRQVRCISANEWSSCKALMMVHHSGQSRLLAFCLSGAYIVDPLNGSYERFMTTGEPLEGAIDHAVLDPSGKTVFAIQSTHLFMINLETRECRRLSSKNQPIHACHGLVCLS
ncbi:hypothetical protein BZG36_05255 [Bifiguratus adelaidae]|uniref:Uncharacterized protein n=1 Tax=Bifiguratus adelaidae TaxID=1938954 RepID=A0A261XUP5_9FUNG|nr:hypothetical protein BZG36_05255 [Bifiguratus adelaidae]